MSRIRFDPALPISARRDEIRAAVERHPVVIVCGETGSGKTTQLPKMLLEMGRARIGHTQPRRIAARSVAARIAEELGAELGGVVGCKVRFHDQVSPRTAIKLMTDGILLAETQGDRELREYDALILDEAHERSLNIDFLLGYAKRLVERRPELRVLVTSATIDAERFSRHFNGAPVVEVSGRLYPVDVRYRPVGGDSEDTTRDEEEAALADAVEELCREGAGDVLVFLPGEREIRDAADTLRRHGMRHAEILPLYARLSAAEQDRVFRPAGARRIVLATNVAETSLTVPRIRYVVDTGDARVKRYSYRNKVEMLRVEPGCRATSGGPTDRKRATPPRAASSTRPIRPAPSGSRAAGSRRPSSSRQRAASRARSVRSSRAGSKTSAATSSGAATRSRNGTRGAARWWRSSAARFTDYRSTATAAWLTGRSMRRRHTRSSSARRWCAGNSRRARRSSRTTGASPPRSSGSSTSRAARTSWSTRS